MIKRVGCLLLVSLGVVLEGCGQSQPAPPKDYSRLMSGRYDVQEAKRLLQQTVVYPVCVVQLTLLIQRL